MLGDININTVLLLLLALEQDGLHRIDESGHVSTNIQNLLDGLHDLLALHFLKLSLSDWNNEADIATVGEQHLDDEVVHALSQLSVGLAHAWQVGVDLVAVDGEMWDESFLLLIMTHTELVMQSLLLQRVLQICRLLNMVLRLLLHHGRAIG